MGSLVQAVVTHYRSRPSGRAPALLSVEPEAAACVLESLTLGEPVSVTTRETIMAGLNCGTTHGTGARAILGGRTAEHRGHGRQPALHHRSLATRDRKDTCVEPPLHDPTADRFDQLDQSDQEEAGSVLTHFVAALGVLGLLTIVPGPDMAVVTRRALVAGRGDAQRTVAES